MYECGFSRQRFLCNKRAGHIFKNLVQRGFIYLSNQSLALRTKTRYQSSIWLGYVVILKKLLAISFLKSVNNIISACSKKNYQIQLKLFVRNRKSNILPIIHLDIVFQNFIVICFLLSDSVLEISAQIILNVILNYFLLKNLLFLRPLKNSEIEIL